MVKAMHKITIGNWAFLGDFSDDCGSQVGMKCGVTYLSINGGCYRIEASGISYEDY